jgi:hypothetical protein
MHTMIALGAVAVCLTATAPMPAMAQAGATAPAAQTPPPPPPPAVKVGEPMPGFTLPYLEPAADGSRPQSKTVSLSAFKGKQVVVLAFFPAAFSPG